MTVKVNTGKAYIANGSGSMMYVTNLDASVNATISSNASGNPRIDAIVIKLNLSATPDQNASNVASIVVVQGTPAASPSAPSDSAIQTAVGSGNPFYRLANVTVANGAASITNANISSQRSKVTLKNIGSIKQTLVATRDSTAITTTSTSYADVPLLSVTLTTDANATLVIDAKLGGVGMNITNERVFFIVNIDGVDEGEESVLVMASAVGSADIKTLSGRHVKTGLAAGSHTVKIRWKVSGNTGSLGNSYGGSELVVEER